MSKGAPAACSASQAMYCPPARQAQGLLLGSPRSCPYVSATSYTPLGTHPKHI